MDTDGYESKEIRPKSDAWNKSQAASGPRYQAPSGKTFTLGKLQIAGILLIIVFIWGIVSAVTIAMFEIHLLALTEFEDDNRADISGFVTDEEGHSLVNATVAIHGTQHFAKTNSEGFYTIEDVREGEYEVEASLKDYGSVTKRVSLNANSPTLVNFILEEGGYDKTINERYGSNLSDLRYLNFATAIFIVIYSSLALMGGILAYFQRFYWIAMFGSLCGIISGILSIGIIIAPILSIIALILIVRHQDEFTTSETSFVDRLFGVRKAEARPMGPPREGAQKIKRPYPTVPPMAGPAGPSYTESEASGMSMGSSTCSACGGTVKSESQGIMCQCGASYHRFCASSISVCKTCGAAL
jgi:hypothetical protein